MARKRIRRTLSLNVSEAWTGNPNETWTPGARFAAGWQKYKIYYGQDPAGVTECRGDPIMIAGYLAAQAAWQAHHNATNWMPLADSPAGLPTCDNCLKAAGAAWNDNSGNWRCRGCGSMQTNAGASFVGTPS